MVEIFLAPKVAPKRALTFLTNGAVTNFAPERMYRINADLLKKKKKKKRNIKGKADNYGNEDENQALK